MGAGQGDLFGGAQADKRAALQQVSDNAGDWMERCLACIRGLARANDGKTGTGEDVRNYTEKKIGAPHHHNAWGAAISQAVREGLLVPTERYVPMKGPKSHARKTPLYRLRSGQ